MSEPQYVLAERRGAIVELRLNRPERLNALSVPLEDALIAHLDALADDPTVSVVVLRGNGRAFSAGADLKERAEEGSTPTVDGTLVAYHDRSAFMRLWGLDKIVIAAVHGYCLGGANHLAGLADLSIVVDDTKLGDPEIRFGNPLLVPILVHLTGVKAARKLLYLGEPITGTESVRLRLGTIAVPEARFEVTIRELADKLAAIPRPSLLAAKRAWNEAVQRRGLRTAADVNAEMLGMTFALLGGGPLPDPTPEPPDPIATHNHKEPTVRAPDPGAGPLLVETDGPVRILTFNRHEVRNALSPELLNRFDDELEIAIADQDIGAIIITGAGTAFSAGIDLKIPVKDWPYPDDYEHTRWLMERCLRLWDSPTPIVAAVNGPALGHACDITAVCDITVASTAATFGVPEIRHSGGVAGMVYPYVMPMKVGRRFLYLGEAFDAETSLQAGLVTEVVAPDELLPASLDLARRLCAIPPAALRQMKRAINRSYDIMGLRDTMAYNLESLAVSFASRDPEVLREREELILREGLTTFIRERDAPFDTGPTR